jgi:hypothetical protein
MTISAYADSVGVDFDTALTHLLLFEVWFGRNRRR